MYKVASDRRQSALHRGQPTDWVHGEEYQTLVDRWRNLKAAVFAIDNQLQTFPPGEERKKIIARKTEIQEELKIINPQIKAANILRGDIKSYFYEIARKELPPGQFSTMAEAAKRLKQQADERAMTLLNGSSLNE